MSYDFHPTYKSVNFTSTTVPTGYVVRTAPPCTLGYTGYLDYLRIGENYYAGNYAER
jgi:hypothetical protein